MTGALDSAFPGSGAGSVPGDGQPDPIGGSGPAMHWARCPAEGLAMQDIPAGSLCLPCVIGVTADMPDPGRMGTAQ